VVASGADTPLQLVIVRHYVTCPFGGDQQRLSSQNPGHRTNLPCPTGACGIIHLPAPGGEIPEALVTEAKH
jgi:hypothetical protein